MSDGVLWELPDNWQWATIADLGNVVSGGTPSTKNPSYWNGEINWITPADLSGYNNKFIMRGAKSLTTEGLENSSAKLMPAGSVHFSSRAPIGYVVISQAEISTNQGFKSIIPASGIFNEYIYYYLKSAKHIAEERAGGTTFKELSGTAFSQLPVPIAPSNEQYRIVSQIEEFFSELDKGIEYLKTAHEQLKVYRQSVLEAAFEGRLTEEWREAHAEQLETADQLLERIHQERENRYQQQLNEWEEAVKAWEDSGREGRKPSKPEELENLSLVEEELIEMAILPVQWCWAKLTSISVAVTDGDHQAPPKENTGIPFIVISNIKNNRIYFESTMYVSQAYYDALPEKRKPISGDVLYTVTGSFGIPCLVDFNKEFCFQRHIALIRLEKLIHPEFIFYFLQSRMAFQQAANAATGTAQKTVSLTGLRRFCIPVAPIDEQIQIIGKVERKFSAIEQLESIVQSELERATILRQSILKKAFSGQLVPQDSSDEHADVLLERIKEIKRHQKENKVSVPRSKKQVAMKKDLSIIEVLQELNGMATAQDVWRRSKHQEDIEGFYAELKKQINNGVIEEVEELREEKKSYLRLRNEN